MRRLAISVCLGLLGVAACARPKPTTPSAATDGTAVAQSQSQATPPLPDVQAQPAQSAARNGRQGRGGFSFAAGEQR
jgi:hypothetical protein